MLGMQLQATGATRTLCRQGCTVHMLSFVGLSTDASKRSGAWPSLVQPAAMRSQAC